MHFGLPAKVVNKSVNYLIAAPPYFPFKTLNFKAKINGALL